MEFEGFGPSHNKIEILLDQKLIRIVPWSLQTYYLNIFSIYITQRITKHNINYVSLSPHWSPIGATLFSLQSNCQKCDHCQSLAPSATAGDFSLRSNLFTGLFSECPFSKSLQPQPMMIPMGSNGLQWGKIGKQICDSLRLFCVFSCGK